MSVDESIVIRLREARQIRVRYGRAAVTVRRFGAVGTAGLECAVDLYAEGSVEAEEVCWAFVRSRVVSESPTFDWEAVELPLLLDRVVAVTTDPKFPSSSAEDVANALVAAVKEEREAVARAPERMEQISRQLGFGAGAGAVGLAFDFKSKFAGVLGQFPLGEAAAVAAKRLTAGHHFDPGIGLADLHVANSKGLAPARGLAEQLAAGYLAPEVKHPSYPGLTASGTVKQFVVSDPARAFGSAVSESLKGHGFGLAGALDTGRDWAASLQPFDKLQGFSGVLGGLQPPPWLDQIQGVDRLQGFSSMLGGLRPPAWWDHFKGIDKLASRFLDVSHDWLGRLKRALPRNWQDLEDDEVDAVVTLMLDTGISLAWAPRTSILRELLAARSPEECSVVLEAKSGEILEDIEDVLGDVTSTRLRSTVDVCREVIASYRNGTPRSAQALASAALSDLVHSYFEEKSFGEIRSVFVDVDPLNDVGFADFGLFSVGRVWVRSFERFEGSEDPAYNRNKTLHLIGPHYNTPNLLAALMLLTGLLKELQRLERRGEARTTESEELAAA